MEEWIKGSELLDPPYKLTKRYFFKAVQEGILVPYTSIDADWIREYGSLGEGEERVWRDFPTKELKRKYFTLMSLKGWLESAQKFWSMSDEEIIEREKSAIVRGESAHPDLETFIHEILPNRRRKASQRLQENPLLIAELEKELAPDKVWKNLNLGPVQQEKLIEDLLNNWYLIEQVESISAQESQKSTTLCAPGTQWKDITITLVSDEMVRIQTPDWDKRLTYHQLDMVDKRKGDSSGYLWALFKLFAENDGFIFSQNPKYDPKLPDTAKRLNTHLKKFFGINESIYTGHYKKERGYRTKIKFRDATHKSPTDYQPDSFLSDN
jgi:hypothetical protein